jgi:hypothetical protein
MEQVVSNNIVNINSWLKCNKLFLNIDKTNFVIFHPPRRKITSTIKIFINQIQISIGNHAMASTIRINSTSDVWKFCQNWTSRQASPIWENFQTSCVLLIPNCTSNIACLLVYY